MVIRRRYKYRETDNRQTPIWLCKKIVDYFKPSGKILEPCCGDGNFLKVLPSNTLWCEIKKGKDFFNFNERVDWIITNPPWSMFSKFLTHSLDLADHVVFLSTFHYIGTKRRFEVLSKKQFWIEDILLVDTPSEWGKWGFQLAVFHFSRYFNQGTCIIKI